MTSVDEFPNTNPCNKLDPQVIDAYFDLQLTPADSTELTLDNSWGPTSVDLAPAIKTGETITHLVLGDGSLQYNREDYGLQGAGNGGVDCINGDDLSKIISMKYLKDVGGSAPAGGDVYMYNSSYSNFQPYNLQDFIDQTNTSLGALNTGLNQAQQNITNVNNRVDGAITDYTNKINTLDTNLTNLINQTKQELQAQITALQTTVGNLQTAFNNYKTATDGRLDAIESTIAKPSWAPSDAVLAWGNVDVELNSNPTGNGIYTHNPNSNVVGDMRFN